MNKNEMNVFTNEEFGQIRTVEINGKLNFIGKDVAEALGYKDTVNAIKQHCKGVVKHHVPHPQNPEKILMITVIPEGDVIRLATKSKLPGAERLESWIFDEVIPSVSKHGVYMTDDLLTSALQSPEVILELAEKLKDEKEAKHIAEQQVKLLKTVIEEQRLKVLKYDTLFDTEELFNMSEIAKISIPHIDGKPIGRNGLFKYLKDKKILFYKTNIPRQQYVNRGYFKVKKTPHNTTMVTLKGYDWLMNMFEKDGMIS